MAKSKHGSTHGSSESLARGTREPDVRWRRFATIRSEVPQASAWFGRSVATDGRYLAIGAPGTDLSSAAGSLASAGVVFLYRIEPDVVVPIATITAPTPCPSMWFGASLAMDDGMLLIGAPGAEITSDPEGARSDSYEGIRTGLAYLYNIPAFAQESGDPSDRAPLVLEPPSIEGGAGFGQSVALGHGFAVVGAPGCDGTSLDANGSAITVEDAGLSALYELPWRGGPGSKGIPGDPWNPGGVPVEILSGPSSLPMSLFATHATITRLRPDGPIFTAHGHLYVEEEAYGPSPGVALHRIR
jgi:hypothetical protein